MDGKSRSHIRAVRLVGAAAMTGMMVMLVGLSAGCQKPLLAPDEERSQYDRFDAVRNQRATPYLEDEFGRKRPNLRGRLLAKD